MIECQLHRMALAGRRPTQLSIGLSTRSLTSRLCSALEPCRMWLVFTFVWSALSALTALGFLVLRFSSLLSLFSPCTGFPLLEIVFLPWLNFWLVPVYSSAVWTALLRPIPTFIPYPQVRVKSFCISAAS